MRQRRIAILVSLLTAGVLGLGGYWVATGQEGRPWPPPPVKVDSATTGAPGTPAVPPPVPPSGTMPPAPADRNDNPIRKWMSNLLPGSATATMKLRACGVGGLPDSVQQVGYQERASDIPPPVPARPTITTPMPSAGEPAPKRQPAPMMPNLPGAASPIPVLPPALASPPIVPPAASLVVPAARAMPIADPPSADPSKSVIADPVQQAPVPAKERRPPPFVLFDKQHSKAPTQALAITPVEPVLPVPQMQGTQQTVARSVSTPDGSRLADVQTPPVMVEKRSMAPVRPGEPCAFQLVVRNLGTVAASEVSVEDDLPADAKVVQGDPTPLLLGSYLAWTLEELAPGGVRVINLTLQGGPSQWSHNTRVRVSSAKRPGTPWQSMPQPQPVKPAPSVAVQVTAPASAMTGRPAIFEVTFANTGKVRVTGLLLHARLSEGLRHPVGQDIEADVGDLPPGVSKTVKVTVTPVLPGRQGLQVHMKSPSGADAAAQAAVEVAAAPTGGLGVQQAPAARVFTGRTTDLRIELTNHSAQPLRGVNVASYIPEGIDLVEASDYGNYQPSGRTVNWLLDSLQPGQTQAVLLRVSGTTPGQFTHTVIARAVGVAEVKSSGTLSVEGVADLQVELHGDNAVELGRETVYEVRIGNPGSGSSTNVRVALEFTPGLVPRNAQGPTAFRIDGQRVLFEPLAPLASQGQTLYRVLVVGQAVGEARIRASVISDQVPTPVQREAATRVYRD